jgi:hypothetical protein
MSVRNGESEETKNIKRFGKNVGVCIFCGNLIDLDDENYGRITYTAVRKASTKFFKKMFAKTCTVGVAHEKCIEEELLYDEEN